MPKRTAASHDKEFIKFLANRDLECLMVYMKSPESSMERYRNPRFVRVFWYRQEYDNTTEHREGLKKRIGTAREKLAAMKTKLALAKVRPASSAMKAPFVAMQCHERHNLEDYAGGRMSGYCMACLELCSKDIPIAKYCIQCNVRVCKACVDKYYPNQDIGFRIFMAREDNSTKASYDHNQRQTERDDMIEPEETHKKIERFRQEYYDTEQHRVDLREQIKEAEACLCALEAESAKAEKQAAEKFLGPVESDDRPIKRTHVAPGV
jgi:hypothetical protein